LREAGLLSFKHPQRLLRRATPLADVFLQVKINGDVALLQGIGKAILEVGAVDESFVRERTENFLAGRRTSRRVSCGASPDRRRPDPRGRV